MQRIKRAMKTPRRLPMRRLTRYWVAEQEKKSDDADALKSSGVDFSKSETDSELDTWSERGY